ncbi:MAG: DUF3592 domain-containing protein [Bacteroidota bacterium]
MPIWARFIFCILGFVAVSTGIRILRQNIQARQWKTAKGKILEIAVTGFDEDFITVKYEYTVRNMKYIGDRFNISKGSVSGATEIAERYRPGTTVDVIYDPKAPRSSALNRDPIFIPIFVISVGTIFFLFGLLATF